jgi:hypothetical protein
MKENRVCLAGVRPPQDDEVRILDFLVGARAAACSEDRRQTDDARGVSRAVATIDVVAADRDAGELLGDEVRLVGGLRAAEEPERGGTVAIDRSADSGGSAVEGLVPGRGAKASVFADERLSQTGEGLVHGRLLPDAFLSIEQASV